MDLLQKPINCFLIEDDLDDQEIFGMALQDIDKSISCIFVSDGVQALAKLNGDQTINPHYIFIDMNMPRINGLQCLEQIRKIERLTNVPIFMYSTYADPASIQKTKQLGATDFILKPSSIRELTNALTELLNIQNSFINEA